MRVSCLQIVLLMAVACVLFVDVNGATISVSTIAKLKTAMSSASAGDEIILADGTYTSTDTSTSTSLKATVNYLTVRATTSGGVKIGTYRMSISFAGSYNTFSGFQFINTTAGTTAIGSTSLVNLNGNHSIAKDLNFYAVYATNYIKTNGTTNNTITNCNFEYKPSDASSSAVLQILPDYNFKLVGSHLITKNTFKNMPGSGNDFGNEPLRLGLGAVSTMWLNATVEYNVFDNTYLADSETISVKSRGNILRYNTVRNNQESSGKYTGAFCFRFGDYNAAYGNYFLSSGGVRVKQANDIAIYNNYFYNSYAPLVFDDVSESSLGTTTTYQKAVTVQFNTFYNNKAAISLGTAAFTSGTWENNLIFNNGTTALFSGETGASSITWRNNFYSGTNGLTSVPTGLTQSASLTSSSFETSTYLNSEIATPTSTASASFPAVAQSVTINNLYSVGGAVTNDPTILLDLAKLTRPTTKTAGSNQPLSSVSSSSSLNKPLTLSDVGPSYTPSTTFSTAANTAAGALIAN